MRHARVGVALAGFGGALGFVGCGAGTDLAPAPHEAARALPERVGTQPGEARPLPPGRQTPFRVIVDLSEREAEVLIGTVAVRGLRLAIGSSTTPTPTGTTRVVAVARAPTGDRPIGCCVLTLAATTARGLTVRIYGTTDEALVGRAATGGDLIGRNADMRWLTANLVAGTPVTIRR